MCISDICNVTLWLNRGQTEVRFPESLKLQSDKLEERRTQIKVNKRTNIKPNNVKSTDSEDIHVYRKDRKMENRKKNNGQHAPSFWKMIERRLVEAKTHYVITKTNLQKLDAGTLKSLEGIHITKQTVIVRSLNEEGHRWLAQQKRFTGNLDFATGPQNVVAYLKQFRDVSVNNQLLQFNYILRQNKSHQIAYFMVYNEIQDVLMKSLPKLSVGIHGSAVTNLGCKGSDLDIVINVSTNKRKMFDQVKTKLEEAESLNIGFCAPHARVPIINVQHCPTKISCDISIESFAQSNSNPMVNAEVLYTMSVLDDRFCSLVRIIKYWASCRGLCKAGANPSPHGITWTLLTLFYFQQKGILPAARRLYCYQTAGAQKTRTRAVLSSENNALCQPLDTPTMRSIDDISKDLKKNDELLVDLLKGFCDYYLAFDFSKRKISIYDGVYYQRTLRHLRVSDGAMEIPLEYKECYNTNVSKNVTSGVINVMKKELTNLHKALNNNNLGSVLKESGRQL
ncbi:poly(A) RNA polymerase cid11-like isoform X2 [Mizuhopecten yessoensis]|uniref:poly(A) RNA polymerase cid11-like isoform X2 n=1 Tax=Mizuhopecten yessoensis TaxID=6573 RepID=UPI000B45E163|nr:poly(A) RNA polymerase cid11-like isoform X2 [Mizuhopecten yessoensis]